MELSELVENRKEQVYNKSIELLKEHDIRYVEELLSYLPISKETFYRYFEVNSNEYDYLKRLISDNVVKKKLELRKKFEESNNPTIMIVNYKLLANEDELRRINDKQIENETEIMKAPDITINGETK